MCGIVGVLGLNPAASILLESLARLEYRGYDSAGIATVHDGKLDRRRAQGKLNELRQIVEQNPLNGTVGIGHTRWATHGVPSEINAHPHIARDIAVVHNGIIENFAKLQQELKAKGYSFETQTDTEVVPNLIHYYKGQCDSLTEAVRRAVNRFEGAFGLVILALNDPDSLVVARKGSPLALGYGDGEMFVGSDALALAPLTKQIQYLEEGDIATVTQNGAEFISMAGEPVERPIMQTAHSGAMIGKGNHAHYMEKEIFEQPAVLGDTLRSFADPVTHQINLPELPFSAEDTDRIAAIACGTASLACNVARYWFEEMADLPVDWDIASEFRYREPPLTKNQVGIFVSQSGETADTLAALRHMKEREHKTLAIVNVPESTLAREADGVLRTLAGPEIGVASTKAFTTQLATLACLTIAMARFRKTIDPIREKTLTRHLDELPSKALQILESNEKIKSVARDFMNVRDVLYLGRGSLFPIALEGALKLKEISYIHAEGYAAGELKHGPLALIDKDVPVIVLAPSNYLFDKTASNLQEVAARGGKVVLIGDREAIEKLKDQCWHTIELPKIDPFVAPILYTLPVQLLAYHTAALKGTDLDQPRNLAKSVTVE